MTADLFGGAARDAGRAGGQALKHPELTGGLKFTHQRLKISSTVLQHAASCFL